MERLLGDASSSVLQRAHVAVVGLGGVGSWVVEALARTGIGTFTLIDLDEICLSNVNRQLPALDGTIGRFKAEVLAERVQAIHPLAVVHPVIEFFTESSASRLLRPDFSAVVDAIDAVGNKCRLIAGCRDRGIPVIACGGAGGRRDPTRVRIADLAEVTHDRLLSEVRRRLRKEFGFPGAGRKARVPCVYSAEPRVELPSTCGTSGSAIVLGDREISDSAAEADVPGQNAAGVRASGGLKCEGGLGSAAFVTGSFGFAAAAWVVETLLERAADYDGGCGLRDRAVH